MTEFTNDSPHEQVSIAELLGEVYAIDDVPAEVRNNPGLVTVEIEGEKFCPKVQFEPNSNGEELYPYLSRAWEIARKEYGEKDTTAEATFLYFVTPDKRWAGSALWDVAVSDAAATVWHRIETQVQAEFREFSQKSES
jgi:hypothetical protein